MRKLLALVIAFLSITSLSAITPMWLRDVKISPNGQEIAFTYKGDIYKVPTKGGEATQLTTLPSYESSPIWSADGKKIAFASDRNGNFDVFVMASTGGVATRVTTNSSKEVPMAFTPDGKNITFYAVLQDPASSALFPTASLGEVYTVSIEGGKPQQVIATPAIDLCYNKKGDAFLYHDKKGFENKWRKHHTSSITRDIWSYSEKTKKHTQLTTWKGEDRNPVYAENQNTVYFLTERFGSFNVASFSLDNPKDVKQVSSFSTHPVRFLSIAANDMLCYTYDGEIYLQKDAAAKPHKVAITIVRDEAPELKDFKVSSGASEAVVSPDGKQIAFIYRGEVFVTAADYTTTKQITHTPEAESGLTFSADGKTLVYATTRHGSWELCKATMQRPEEMYFSNATLLKEEMILPSTKIERAYPKFSPDGKELAFVEDRAKLKVLNLKSKKVREITDGTYQYDTDGEIDFSWSPDAKWFVLRYVANGHNPYSDIGIVSSNGGTIKNITNSGYFDLEPRWVMDGTAILFLSERYGMRNQASWGSQNDVMIAFLNQEAYDKFKLSKEEYELKKEFEKEQKKAQATKAKKEKKKSKKKAEKADDKKEKETKKEVVIEWDNIEDRIVRLTPNSSDLNGAVIDKEGEKLYYLSSFEKGFDLWVLNLRDRSTKLLKKMNTGWVSMQLDKSQKHLFLLGRSMKKITLSSGTVKPISFKSTLTMDAAKEREYMFNEVCLQESKRFYNKNMHGVDWKKMTTAYRKFLPYIGNNYDFSDLLSELLGELNVSHTGSGYRPSLKGHSTASLGLLFNWDYAKKGLLIDEIIEKGPFDTATTKVKKGDIIEKIDGITIEKGMDYYPLLADKTNKKVLLSILNPSTGQRWDEVVKAMSKYKLSALLYKRWVKQRAADVEKWSNGRLGYVHIASMSDASFRTIYADILGKYNKCEGIVIDTRFNGGGRLHEDIEVLFSGNKYFTQVVRGKEACDMPSRRWNKPSIMLQCEANYSNAHGTPWVYKHCGLGKLVGMPVPGTMTSVNWITLQDRSLYFGIPVVGYRLPDGSYLENKQLEPDVKVANENNAISQGFDAQLKAAVDELLKDIAK